MPDKTDDGYDCFRQLVERMREEGFSISAMAIDQPLTSAWTTSSELIGELGIRILAFERQESSPFSEQLRQLLDQSMARVRSVWPDIK
jgi:hypothetical protein